MTKNSQPLAFALFLAIGVFGYLLPAVGYFSSVPGDLADARLNSVFLEHVYRWVMRREPSLWSPSFFYPFEGVLAFSDNHFGSAITYIIFRWLHFKRELAYDGWFFVGACLNYLAAFFMLRRLEFSGLAAATGAFVFAFSLPTMMHQDAHAQLVHRYAIPLAALAFFRALEGRRLFDFWPVFFWTAVQFYCSIYLGVFLVYLLGAMAFGLLFFKEGRRRLAQTISSIPGESTLNRMLFVAVAVISALAVGWLLYRYHMVSKDYGFKRLPTDIAGMLPRPGSYLLADRSWLSSWVGSRVDDLPMRWEHQMFLGIGVLLVAVYGVLAAWTVKRHELLGRVALISFALLFAATLYVNGHSMYFLLMNIPGISAVRGVGRIILVMILPIAILVAIGTERIRSAAVFKDRKALAILTIGLGLLLGTETTLSNTYSTSISDWRDRINTLKKLLPERLPDHPILYVSQASSDWSANLVEQDAMILAQDMGIPTLNGDSGNSPPGYMPPAPCLLYSSRLYGYADFRHRPRESVADLVRRVVQIAPEPCRGELLASSNQVMTKAEASLIGVRISGIDYSKNSFDVVIDNHSPVFFNPISTKGQIKLSWRFVPVNAAGVALSDPGWEMRKELWSGIRPNGSIVETIETKFPPPLGFYRLEVSLVQEGVSWFHDLGMSVGVAPINPGGR